MKILFLQKRPLFPTDTGGKIRTLNIVRHLAQWHDVTYLCNMQAADSDAIAQMRALGVELKTVPWIETPRGSLRFYCQLAANLFSRYPFNVNKDYDPALRATAEQLLRKGDYDLLICDFVQMARNAIGLGGVPSLLFQHNVEAEIFQRHATTDHNWLRRRYMGLQFRKMERFECEAGRHFDAVIAVSERDREMFKQRYGWQHVHVIDTAVDVDYFQPRRDPIVEDRVVFVGSLDWLPNEDGVVHFVDQIWPGILQRRPQATFQIVGRNPTGNIEELARLPGIEVVGAVPDVRPFLMQAAAVVVPLRIGGGTRIKIYEAMAMQKVVVSTHLGAEGLNVSDGANILLADDAEEFASRVADVLASERRRTEIETRARELVVENYTAEQVAQQFDELCQHVTMIAQ